MSTVSILLQRLCPVLIAVGLLGQRALHHVRNSLLPPRQRGQNRPSRIPSRTSGVTSFPDHRQASIRTGVERVDGWCRGAALVPVLGRRFDANAARVHHEKVQAGPQGQHVDPSGCDLHRTRWWERRQNPVRCSRRVSTHFWIGRLRRSDEAFSAFVSDSASGGLQNDISVERREGGSQFGQPVLDYAGALQKSVHQLICTRTRRWERRQNPVGRLRRVSTHFRIGRHRRSDEAISASVSDSASGGLQNDVGVERREDGSQLSQPVLDYAGALQKIVHQLICTRTSIKMYSTLYK